MVYIESALHGIDRYYKEKEHFLMQYGDIDLENPVNVAREIESCRIKRELFKDIERVINEDEETLKNFNMKNYSREWNEKNRCLYTRRLAPARVYEICEDGVDIIHPAGRILIPTKLFKNILNASVGRLIKID